MGAVRRCGIHIQKDAAVGLLPTQGGQINIPCALVGFGKEQIIKQNCRLTAGDSRGSGKADSVGEARLAGYRHIAVIPIDTGGHVGVAVAQHPHQDGNRLAVSYLAVGLKVAIAHACDEAGTALAVLTAPQGNGGRQIDIAAGPMGGPHIQKNGAVALAGLLIALVHNLYSHFAEFGPGQDAAGVKGSVAGAADHAQQAQNLGGLGHLRVGDVGKGAALRSGSGIDQQPCQHGGCKEQGQHSFQFHSDFSFTL